LGLGRVYMFKDGVEGGPGAHPCLFLMMVLGQEERGGNNLCL
jgi:hypothetical protein